MWAAAKFCYQLPIISISCGHSLLCCFLATAELTEFFFRIPEYAYTLRVNEKSDIYSFGVVVLELVTGKLPVGPEYGEKDLVKWVCSTLDQKGINQDIDPKLDSCFKEDISKVLQIGLLCTSPLPINRPPMRKVVKMLQEVGGGDQLKTALTDGKLTPYYHEDASDQGNVA